MTNVLSGRKSRATFESWRFRLTFSTRFLGRLGRVAQSMATTAPAPPRTNATRPENLASSNKRTSRQSLLALYSQLLPLAPPPSTYLSTLLSSLPGLSLTTPQIEAVWDELTQTIWVNHEPDMQRLWRQGFFGKGFLSRSEPSWRRRVENRRAEIDGKQKRKNSYFSSFRRSRQSCSQDVLAEICLVRRSHIGGNHCSTSSRTERN